MARRRLAVDWPSCKGHAVCAELLPEIVQIDEWGYPVLAPGAVPESLRKHAQRAVKSCPTMALRLVDAGDEPVALPFAPAPVVQPAVAPLEVPVEVPSEAQAEPRMGERRAARLSAPDGPRRRARRSS